MPKEITIAEGVKIVIDRDCDKCVEINEYNRQLYESNCRLDAAVNDILHRERKLVSNTWDKGYNQCLSDVKNAIAKYILP